MYIKIVRRIITLGLAMLVALSQFTLIAYAAGDSLWDSFKSVGGEILDSAGEAAGGLFSSAKEKTPEVLESAKDNISKAQEATSGFLQNQQDQFWERTEQQIYGDTPVETTTSNTSDSPSEPVTTEVATAPSAATENPIEAAPAATVDNSADNSQHSVTDNSIDNSQQTTINIYDGGSIYRYEMAQPSTEEPGGEIIVVNGQVYQRVDEAASLTTQAEPAEISPDYDFDFKFCVGFTVAACAVYAIGIVKWSPDNYKPQDYDS